MEDLIGCKSIWQEKNTKPKYTPKPLGEGPCPECGQPTILKIGVFGKFYSCCTFPRCKGSRNYE
jgi:ssDNA-binding Zn-finger/Zn-ribbon topoisomerase 1